MDPVVALRRIAFLLERQLAETHRIKAYRKAADRLEQVGAGEVGRLAEAGSLATLADVGPKTALIAGQALAGGVPDYLAELEAAAGALAPGAAEVRSWIRGDLHTHSIESDGGSPIEHMAAAAIGTGLEYMVLTDHSPRLTVANGLSADRLRDQLRRVAALNAELAPFRILTGIEVDILDGGSLDQEPELLAELDVVVASVHSKLRMPAEQMTRRMVNAIANPHVDVLGHCTGRLITGGRGTRPESSFDAELVFEACRRFGVAVEINSRPERRDPPTRLLELAHETGCVFAVDTDAHAPGQLDFLDYGCARVAELGIEKDRIVNTMTAEDLLAWTRT
ncbi:PHP domain-containing protein [Pseudactinotalea suaedae]|uniref:PHP domain-containing protein n=1 Tax=Pseudactinotalea suaedae TaxID=1524924 RepID=UPI0012E2CA5A|nr:PHP domain-containing protein [Pseudactinotalea suaedae]